MTMPCIKITGAADKPLQLIRRYKNERHPNVAVTVDLLTTGIDVPEICNLVFLRRVNSRILFDQMLGRATRLATRSARRPSASSMRYGSTRPCRPDRHAARGGDPDDQLHPARPGTGSLTGDEERALVRDQFLAKLQRKKRHLTRPPCRTSRPRAGMPPDDFLQQLCSHATRRHRRLVHAEPGLGEILDRKGRRPAPSRCSSRTIRTSLLGAEHGYGNATRARGLYPGVRQLHYPLRSRAGGWPVRSKGL